MMERPKLETPVQMFDLTALDKPAPRATHCGGALVPVTRDTMQALARRYEVDFHPVDIPPAGKAEARVVCTAEVLATSGVGGIVHLATCARCAGIEASVRAMLAEVAARAGK